MFTVQLLLQTESFSGSTHAYLYIVIEVFKLQQFHISYTDNFYDIFFDSID